MTSISSLRNIVKQYAIQEGLYIEMNSTDHISLNGKEYRVLRLLGKGKGGYSYLVTDGKEEYVLKQIHHEPCDYYQFGDKIQSELKDYATLSEIGIRMPKMLDSVSRSLSL